MPKGKMPKNKNPYTSGRGSGRTTRSSRERAMTTSASGVRGTTRLNPSRTAAETYSHPNLDYVRAMVKVPRQRRGR